MQEKAGSRDKFVLAVKRVILADHKTKEAFIFGLSGKWGEGKTSFLESLEDKLLDKNPPSFFNKLKSWLVNLDNVYAKDIYRCVRAKLKHTRGFFTVNLERAKLDILLEYLVNTKPWTRSRGVAVISVHPWKYAHEDNSILRELLREISDLNSNPVRRLSLRKRLKALDNDISKNRISLIHAALAFFILILLVILYKYPPILLAGQQEYISANKTLFILLFVPILLATMNAITTSQSSSRAITTRDSFDALFEKLVKKVRFNKIVIYVDDMDRLTAKKALLIMDTLRTFFDKPKLVFIVASDNTILEGHLGRELLPRSLFPDQIEEGRRFLKKIFNVYWRLPLPTKPEFEAYIDDLLPSDSVLHKWLKNDEWRNIFKSYLSKYFSNNYRNAERFVSRVKFTFGLIEAQYHSDDFTEENREYFKEMLENPILVIRVLMLEEFANPLYDKMQHRPDILLEIEGAVTRGDFVAEINKHTGKPPEPSILSNEQRLFLESFIPTEPRFKDKDGINVKSIHTFVSYYSDSSFGDIRGLSADEFYKFIENGSIPELVINVKRSSDQNLVEATENFVSVFGSIVEPAQKLKLLDSFVQTGLRTEPVFFGREAISESLKKIDLDFVEQTSSKERTELYNNIGYLYTKDEDLEVVFNNSKPLEESDFQEVANINSLSPLGQWKFVNAFEKYFTQDTTGGDMLNIFASNLDKFSGLYIEKYLGSLSDYSSLTAYFMNNDNDQYRSSIVAVLRKTKDGFDKLKTDLSSQLKNKNRTIFNWLARDRKESAEPIFGKDEEIVKMSLPDKYSSVDSADLAERIGLFQSFPEAKNILWEELIKFNDESLLKALLSILGVSAYSVITPSSEIANTILRRMLRYYISEEMQDDNEAHNWLQVIEPSQWLYVNMILDEDSKSLIGTLLDSNYVTDRLKEQLNRIRDQFDNR